jgi:tetratricopeptide (TPR) repeat protein
VSLGVIFPLVALFPVSNWVLPIAVLMAERFLYLPLFGVALAFGIAFSEIRSRERRYLVAAGGFLCALILCVGHNYVWRNEYTFYENMIRVAPQNAKARLGYGFALIEAGRKPEAEEHLQAGLRILPDNPALLSTLALARMTPGDCSQSFPLLNRALEINPKHGDTLRRLADCLYREGDKAGAADVYSRAVDNSPFPDALMLFMWALSLEEIGQKDSALRVYQRANLIDPANLFIREKLAALKTQ